MSANRAGQYTGANGGHGQFRRATGKVAMAAVPEPAGGYQQNHYQPGQQLQGQQFQANAGNYQQHVNNGGVHSAMAAPYDPRMQQLQHQQQQPTGYYSNMVSAAHHPPQHPQHPQHPQQQWQDPASAQAYYQQTINGAARAGFTDGSSDGALDLYTDHKQNQQHPQQMRPGTGHRALADSAVHSSAYANQPGPAAEAALASGLQQLGLGARHAPVAPRQHMTAEAIRQREQALEDAYDEDDGLAGTDIDVTLFPANASQVVGTMRAGSSTAATPASPIRQTGKNPAPTHPSSPSARPSTPMSPSSAMRSMTASADVPASPSATAVPSTTTTPSNTAASSAITTPSDTATPNSTASPSTTASSSVAKDIQLRVCSDSASVRIKKCTSLYAPTTGARVAAGTALPLDSPSLPSRQKARTPWTGVARSNTSALSRSDSTDKPRHIWRRQPSNASAMLHRRGHNYAHIDDPSSSSPELGTEDPALSPLPPHWRKCTRNHSAAQRSRSTAKPATAHPFIHPASPFTVARTHAHVPAGARPPTSRNVSSSSARPPADIAAAQRLHGSGNGSGFSTVTNSPALGARQYVQGDGFDSSSDHLHMGGRSMPPPQQQQHYLHQQPQQQYLQPQPQQQQHYLQQETDHNGQSHSSSSFEPSAPSLIYANQGQPGHNAPYAGSHPVYGGPGITESSYSHSSNGDGMTLHDPALQPPSSMRPWTASSRSLPLAAPSPHFAERERPSSSASSTTGMPPMGVHPSASAAPESAPKAPTPTVASLDAYRTSIKRSNDPAAQLDFAKYVLEHARGIADNEMNPKLSKKRYDMLTEEGLKWVRKLAGTGITVHRSNIAAEAQYFLGTIHSRGIYGVTRDDGKAFSYYQQASKAQHAEANYRTAVCYEVGVGTRRDPARALQFYRKAAAQTNVPAMYKLGLILIKGLLGISPSPREGINWLKRGADNATPDCPHSLHELALCHESSDIPGVIPDETYARQLYIKAGKLGYVPSQVRLGQAYEYGSLGCPVDPRRSIGWYTRAAEKNDGDAELALSGWYLTGAEPHLPQNDVEAFLWARRAADHRLAKAEYAVGYYYECGIGVAHPDVNEAQKWYLKAAQQKNRRAAARLKELQQMGVNIVPPSRAARPRRGKGSMF